MAGLQVQPALASGAGTEEVDTGTGIDIEEVAAEEPEPELPAEPPESAVEPEQPEPQVAAATVQTVASEPVQLEQWWVQPFLVAECVP